MWLFFGNYSISSFLSRFYANYLICMFFRHCFMQIIKLTVFCHCFMQITGIQFAYFFFIVLCKLFILHIFSKLFYANYTICIFFFILVSPTEGGWVVLYCFWHNICIFEDGSLSCCAFLWRDSWSTVAEGINDGLPVGPFLKLVTKGNSERDIYNLCVFTYSIIKLNL